MRPVFRILAIGLIFVATAIAWLALSGTIVYRTESQQDKLRHAVGQLWGSPQTQPAPEDDTEMPAEGTQPAPESTTEPAAEGIAPPTENAGQPTENAPSPEENAAVPSVPAEPAPTPDPPPAETPPAETPPADQPPAPEPPAVPLP